MFLIDIVRSDVFLDLCRNLFYIFLNVLNIAYHVINFTLAAVMVWWLIILIYLAFCYIFDKYYGSPQVLPPNFVFIQPRNLQRRRHNIQRVRGS